MSNDKSISKKQFKKEFLKGKSGYIKKPKSWKRIHIWWEPMEDNEQWFINIASDIRKNGEGLKIEDSNWITAKNLDIWLNGWDREKYKFYLNE